MNKSRRFGKTHNAVLIQQKFIECLLVRGTIVSAAEISVNKPNKVYTLVVKWNEKNIERFFILDLMDEPIVERTNQSTKQVKPNVVKVEAKDWKLWAINLRFQEGKYLNWILKMGMVLTGGEAVMREFWG